MFPNDCYRSLFLNNKRLERLETAFFFVPSRINYLYLDGRKWRELAVATAPFDCGSAPRTTSRTTRDKVCPSQRRSAPHCTVSTIESAPGTMYNCWVCWFRHLLRFRHKLHYNDKQMEWISEWEPLRNFWAPSKHSGESSLSPKDPSSSETRMSAFSGASHSRMSHETIVTLSPHSSSARHCNLQRSTIFIACIT